MENGLQFHVNWEAGQKTGYFLDQRDNRLLLRSLSAGTRVLDAFCYAGGFAANALMGGADWVDAVDGADIANELTSKNLSINNYTGKFSAINSDVLTFLKNAEPEYDLIILDPPAYAKHMSARHQAVQGYKRLNALALTKLKKKGFLFTFSCSQVVDKVLFENTVVAAAIETGKMARVLYRLGQPADHPVNIFHPESDYLKGLVLAVE
jgi:23S rRNA (cytosine1962-C5)-methyltransferase